jgi:hypothetical protein
MAETLTAEYSPREQELRELLDGTKNRFFWCNTDRRGSVLTKGGYDLEQAMHIQGYAAAWEEFEQRGHMKQVRRGDAIFMFAKGGVGIVGSGCAKTEVQVLQPGDPDRLGNSENTRTLIEWRVPVHWLEWRRDRDAFRPKTSLRPTFLEVTQDRVLRNAVREHFLGRA